MRNCGKTALQMRAEIAELEEIKEKCNKLRDMASQMREDAASEKRKYRKAKKTFERKKTGVIKQARSCAYSYFGRKCALCVRW